LDINAMAKIAMPGGTGFKPVLRARPCESD
jgi:hypothetical protein